VFPSGLEVREVVSSNNGVAGFTDSKGVEPIPRSTAEAAPNVLHSVAFCCILARRIATRLADVDRRMSTKQTY